MNSFLLTFDLEEFDLPREHNILVKKGITYRISYEGTKKILDVLRKYNIRVTFFVESKFGKKYPGLLKELIAQKHEIALHGWQHGDNYQKMEQEDALKSIKKAKRTLENIIGKPVIGFRAPRLKPPKYEILRKAGILYDSSLHPTYVPRRYNNFFSSRKWVMKEGIKIVPISVTPIFRLPFSWIWFRNLGLNYSKFCTKLSLLDQDYVNIYFHPWEFVELNDYEFCKDLPRTSIRHTGKRLQNMLDRYIGWCLGNRLEFLDIRGYLGMNHIDKTIV